MQLMAIPGVSGREAAVANFIATTLRKAGLPAAAIGTDRAHTRSPSGGECGNLIVKLPGSPGMTRAPRRMFLAHMDTVPVCVGCTPAVRGRRVVSTDRATGAGADNRSGVAVVLNTALHLLKHKLPHPPLTLLFTIQEETGLIGARFASPRMLGNPKLALSYDGGSASDLVLGATGAYHLDIAVTGLASHAGTHPDQGVSAVTIAARAVADLEAHGWLGLIEKGKQRGTSNVGSVHGGSATNVVTDAVALQAEVRSHSPAFRGRIVAAWRRAFEKAARSTVNHAGKSGKVKLTVTPQYEAFKLKADDPAVRAAAAAIRAMGRTPNRRVVNGGLDANWLKSLGIPTVTLGCGTKNAHTVNDALDLPQFHQGLNLALRLATAID